MLRTVCVALASLAIYSHGAVAQMPPVTDFAAPPPPAFSSPKHEWLTSVYASILNSKLAGIPGEGEAVVQFVVSPAGRIRSVGIAKSSGVRKVDEAALAMVRRADPLPRPPAIYGGREISLKFTARFDKGGAGPRRSFEAPAGPPPTPSSP